MFPFAVKNAGGGKGFHITRTKRTARGKKEALFLRKKLVLKRGKKG